MALKNSKQERKLSMCHFHSLCNVSVICYCIVARMMSPLWSGIIEMAWPVKAECLLRCVTPRTCKESSVECGRYMKGALLHRLGSGISSWPGHKLEAKSQPHFTWPPSPTATMATVAGTNCCYDAMYCFYPPPPTPPYFLLWMPLTQLCVSCWYRCISGCSWNTKSESSCWLAEVT